MQEVGLRSAFYWHVGPQRLRLQLRLPQRLRLQRPLPRGLGS